MKVAISTDGNMVSAHFGRCPSYTIVEIDEKKVVKRDLVQNPGHQPGFIPEFLHEKGVGVSSQEGWEGGRPSFSTVWESKRL